MKTKKILPAGAAIFAVLIFITSCGANGPTGNQAVPGKNMAYNTTRGEELFKQKCLTCHGPEGNYENSTAANLQISKIDSITIINAIVNGKSPMPMFDHSMPDSDLAQLELYVKSLRK